MGTRLGAIGSLAAACTLFASATVAQELTPRTYWPAPRGTRIAVIGYAYSTGDVLFDPSIPLYGVDSRLNTAIVAYLQTFSLAERTANILVELPYGWGTTEGLIEGTTGRVPGRGDYSGFGDVAVTLAVNLIGAPSMTPHEFQALRDEPHPIVGASLKVVAPTGSHDPTRLVNVGANRWAARVGLGTILPLRPKWLLEFDAAAWVFGDDDEFLAGRREQDSILGVQTHLVRRFRPGFWASLDLNYFVGGRQTIGNERLGDVQRNSRFGGTIVVPFADRSAVKIGYATGIVTSFGTDADQVLVSYQVRLR